VLFKSFFKGRFGGKVFGFRFGHKNTPFCFGPKEYTALQKSPGTGLKPAGAG
jgi:hypothetical protein